ncbi:MAG TPA: type IX secretion system membrane protein PorP/SprF [Cytophagaceae bacterium]|jgi:type IX secretion system PorP/SprF family membrane protein|nr:type IX secretion system membrane protein PorP/SprF [Cytophagaceae bacterium]
MNISRTIILVKSILVLTLLLFSGKQIVAQDIQYSQFYNVPMYQNPAFAGSAHATRVVMHQRLQWPSLDAKYSTSLVSVDHFFANYNSGVGLMVQQDYQGKQNISSTEVHGLYSYELPVSREVSIRAGLDLGYISRFTNYNQTVPQQFDPNAVAQTTGSNPYANYPNKKGYVDVSSGGLVYTKQWWMGLAASHLDVPNIAPIGTSRLPMKFALTGGYKIPLIHKKYMAYLEDETEITLTPTFQYKSQGKSDQLDLGAYVRYSQIMFGAWYRGIPVKHYTTPEGHRLQNNESIVAMVGMKYQSISVTYSYDIVISRLGRYNPGGAHEFNITWVHHRHKKKHKQLKRLPCPSFH